MIRFLALGNGDLPSTAWRSTTQKAKPAVGPWDASQVILACASPKTPFALHRLISRAFVVHGKSHVVM